MTADFIGNFANYLKLTKEVTKDNVAFRIVTAGSFGVLMVSAALAGFSAWFGDPIVCQGEETNLIISSACWIHGTRPIKQIEGEDICINDNDEDDKVTTLYYQWVVLMLIGSAIMFRIPGWTWSLLEGGLMKAFYNADNKGYKTLTLKKGDLSDAIEINEKFFNNIKGTWSTTVYYLKFLGCQLLSLLLLILNFKLTNKFLNNKFTWYGVNVVEYYEMEDHMKEQRVNPMCNAFPTKVSCNLKYFGTSGGESSYNDFCILRQNIINEKIYFFLWFWFVAMFTLTACQLFVEICFLALPFVRQFFIFQGIGTRFLTSDMKAYLKNCSIGDIFVLYQMSKNTHTSFFYQLLENLSGDSEDDDPEKKAMLTNADGPDMELNDVKTVS